MKRFLGVVTFLFSFLLVFPAWSMMEPDRLVDKTVQEVLEIIGKDEKIGDDKERMLDLIETKILPHFNFTRMTQLDRRVS